MTMNNIISKLRKKNIRNYYMLISCNVLSVILTTSFAIMYFSSTVQNILPVGGDSRKQAFAIFSVAIVGCVVFTTYASTLFFKYKSHEFGIFMALGEKKKHLKLVILRELAIILPLTSLCGLVLSIPVSFGIWKVFQLFIVDTKEMNYKIGWNGLLFGAIFCVFITFCVFIMGVKFIKRSNVIEIIQEQRKTEITKEIKPYYRVVGWILVVIGVFLGYMVPLIVAEVFKFLMPAIWNVTFIFSLIGIYMIMLYTIAYSKKGKNPNKYYKNIVSTNMMKFLGRQTVKNMCVITFLIAGALFAAFYVPVFVSEGFIGINEKPVDYSFFYKATEKQISKNEICELGKNYGVNIKDYYETQSISLIGGGIKHDLDDDNRYIETYIDKIRYSNFFSESEFNRISGQKVRVGQGEYYTIITPYSSENIWRKWDDLKLATHPTNGECEKLKFAGTVEYSSLVRNGSISYLISDEDYIKFSKDLPQKNYDKYVLFNEDNVEKTYSFAKKLKDEIIGRSSKDVAVIPLYDEYEKQVAVENGNEYFGDKIYVELSSNNNQLWSEWKYCPSFRIIDKQDIVKNMAVFLMLFIYIAVICFVAVAIIAYTRSVTIAIDNKNLFNDIKKLGANNRYIEGCIKKQLVKIFIYPTLVGSLGAFMVDIMMLWGNSRSFSPGEINALVINGGIIVIVFLFMYLIYRLAFYRAKTIIKKE